MRANLVYLFMVLFMVFSHSNPASCKGSDEGGDKQSGMTEYQSLVSERQSDGYTIKVDLSGQVLTLDGGYVMDGSLPGAKYWTE